MTCQNCVELKMRAEEAERKYRNERLNRISQGNSLIAQRDEAQSQLTEIKELLGWSDDEDVPVVDRVRFLTSRLSSAKEEVERWRTSSERWQREHDSAIDAVVSACLESRAWPKDKQAAGLRDRLLSQFDPLMNVTQRLRAAAPSPELCGVTFYVTIPPGITKPMSRCINTIPCADHPQGAAPSPEGKEPK